MEELINNVFCLDNLELLKKIPSNSIDLIYCDILYNTGKNFGDYEDKLGTPIEAIDWYKPRLIEIERILKDKGNVWIQCDYNLSHYIKVEMDSIFPFFINEIIWQYPKGIKNIPLEAEIIKVAYMYDALVSESVHYSILRDFEFTKEGKVVIINPNTEQVKKNIEFLLEYLYYYVLIWLV